MASLSTKITEEENCQSTLSLRRDALDLLEMKPFGYTGIKSEDYLGRRKKKG